MGHPLRTCVGCRRKAPAPDLLRVVARDGVLTPDPGRVLPGRGAHVHPTPACLDLALRRKAFSRALRVAGPLDPIELANFLTAPSENAGPGR